MQSIDQRFEKVENAARIGYLIGCFITHTLSDEESEELDEWILAEDENMEIFADMTEDSKVDEFIQWLEKRNVEQKLLEIKADPRFHRKDRKWWTYAAAASIIVAVGLFFLVKPKEEATPEPVAIASTNPDIQPGIASAILRLPDGKTINLAALKDTSFEGVTIHNGELHYSESEEQPVAMHEVIIPRKGFYSLVLPDGTKVFLNNASSILYPSAFTGDTREVTVTGESFFEVAKDAHKPFIVSVNNVKVQALGTQFGIRAYNDEPSIKATLTEGSIKVYDGVTQKILSPSEQVVIHPAGWKVVELADTYPETAWKDNLFRFTNAKFEDVMKTIERWYDAKVVYAFNPSLHLNATIRRDVPVSKLLALLESTNEVHFSIDGETITVRK